KLVLRHVKTDCGLALTKEDARSFSGSGDKGVLDYIHSNYGVRLDEKRFVISVWEGLRRRRHLPRMPGALSLVKALSARGVPIAVASSSPEWYVRKYLKAEGFFKYIRAIASGDEVEKRKPDPAVYLLAAKRLGIDPKDCFAIEDSVSGVRAAKRAGMACIAVRSAHARGHDLSRADWVVPNISETIQIVRKLTKTPF
ncbi:MAG: HAD-IA family hydrolase, partial [archaeon]